jgi:hypothetical protein
VAVVWGGLIPLAGRFAPRLVGEGARARLPSWLGGDRRRPGSPGQTPAEVTVRF